MQNLELIQKACKSLREISPRPLIEAQWILSAVLKQPVSDIYQNLLSIDDKNLFLEKVNERKKGWPIAYVLKEVYFFNYLFYIDHGVFIPRPESEIIIKEALELKLPTIKGIDFGSGSGALSIALLNEHSKSKFVALEISPSSLNCIKINRNKFNLKDRLYILNQDVSSVKDEEIQIFLNGKPNFILANPPYIKPQDKNLQKEVRQFEPPLSLFSSKDGMAFIYTWFYKAMELLEKKGVYIFEFGYNQKEKVENFLIQENCKHKIINDEQNFSRVAVCWKDKT